MTLPCALVLPCDFLSTLGKNHICRVPVNLHTANYGAHGKIEVSGSETTVELSWMTSLSCLLSAVSHAYKKSMYLINLVEIINQINVLSKKKRYA